jgi:hypothetical protein
VAFTPLETDEQGFAFLTMKGLIKVLQFKLIDNLAAYQSFLFEGYLKEREMPKDPEELKEVRT